MKKYLLIYGAILSIFTGCDTVNRLNSLVHQSSNSIDANREAVEYNTMVILRNKQLVGESNRTLEENRRGLEALSK